MVIDVKNVTVQYTISNFREIGLKEYLIKKIKRDIKTEQFTAVDNVSFSLDEGDFLGIIGTNGAGKSTILKMITGVSFPNSGTITVRGKVAALLELTAGFSLDMTGMENIYLKGYLLGLNDDQIKEIEQDIIDFADLGEYIDQPVRTYSSGMKMRLGFAININIKPDILVVDEALSVGDADFQKKCRDKINDVIATGVTVLFVSHSRKAIEETCTRAIFLKDGKVQVDGTVEEAFDAYDKKK